MGRDPAGGRQRRSDGVTAEAPVLRVHGNAYNIFILVLTILSLAVMAMLVMPWVDAETRQLLNVYDNAAA